MGQQTDCSYSIVLIEKQSVYWMNMYKCRTLRLMTNTIDYQVRTMHAFKSHYFYVPEKRSHNVLKTLCEAQRNVNRFVNMEFNLGTYNVIHFKH